MDQDQPVPGHGHPCHTGQEGEFSGQSQGQFDHDGRGQGSGTIQKGWQHLGKHIGQCRRPKCRLRIAQDHPYSMEKQCFGLQNDHHVQVRAHDHAGLVPVKLTPRRDPCPWRRFALSAGQTERGAHQC
jgi:hypothetical protein